MTKKILILNGPNLNLLGQRQVEIYGGESLADIEDACVALGHSLALEVELQQSNHEGVLIDWVHAARGSTHGIVINPGGYSHSSVALLDALNAYEAPVVEVHISNIHKRESFRHHSYISQRANAVIAGCGTQGYELAMRHIAHLLAEQ
ncbi:type II 3-dehydroquinate dehydratase [Pseudooceanicola sp.]|uniref:type II 3-dehydroquinate dehydratase n=1 Tax=Pseudooceanicola sp. TaxID=1914328 RepID=UPI0026147316|nr:type II 3-dehydroquinate dehydratase [Pseudooceanicola sp.]MDF1855391.1 type II 3-dehydroquinate dehydratase [Pseudooceanicola sp.]